MCIALILIRLLSDKRYQTGQHKKIFDLLNYCVQIVNLSISQNLFTVIIAIGIIAFIMKSIKQIVLFAFFFFFGDSMMSRLLLYFLVVYNLVINGLMCAFLFPVICDSFSSFGFILRCNYRK